MSARYLSRVEYQRISRRLNELVEAAGGKAEAGRIIGVHHDIVARAISDKPEHANRGFRFDYVMDLEMALSRPIVTELAAEMLGFVLVPVPRAGETPAAADLVGRVSKMLAEVSDVSGGVARALDDGAISADEARRIHREIGEAMAALATLDQQVLLAATDEEGESE